MVLCQGLKKWNGWRTQTGKTLQHQSLCRGTRAILLVITSVCPYTVKIVGSMTAVILFSKETNSLTCWVFNETNLSPSLPSPGRCRQLWLELLQHFGFGNAFTCDDVLRIEHLFQNAPATACTPPAVEPWPGRPTSTAFQCVLAGARPLPGRAGRAGAVRRRGGGGGGGGVTLDFFAPAHGPGAPPVIAPNPPAAFGPAGPTSAAAPAAASPTTPVQKRTAAPLGPTLLGGGRRE